MSPPARAGENTENNDTEDSQVLLASTRRKDGAIRDSAAKQSPDDSSSHHGESPEYFPRLSGLLTIATTPAVEALTEWDDLSSFPSGIPVLKERPAGSQESLRSIARLKYPPTVQRRPSTSRRRAQTLAAERSVSGVRYADAAVLQLPMTTPPRPSHLLNSSDTAGVGRSATVRSAHSTSSKASLAATTSSIGSTPSASPAAITKASVASLHPAKSTMLDKLRASASSRGLVANEDQADIETPSRLPVLVRRRAGGTRADDSPVSASASEPISSSPASAKSEKIKNRKGTPFNIDRSAASPGRFKRSDAGAPPVPSAQYLSTATPRADDLAPAISGGQVSKTEDAGGLSSGEETGNLGDRHFVSPARQLYSQDEQNEASSREMSHPRQALEPHRRTRSVPEGPGSPSSLQPSLLFPAPASTAPSEDSYESDDSRRRPLWAAVGDLRTLDDPSHDPPPSAGTPPFSVRSTSSATGSAISSCSNYDSEPLHHDTPQWTTSRRGPSDLEPPGTVSTLSTQTIETPDMAQEERSMLPELKLTSPGRTETHVQSEITPPNARRLQYPSKYARRVPPQVVDESELRQMPSTSTGTGDRSTAPPEDPVHTAVLEEYFSRNQSTYTRLGRQAVASISSLSSKASMEDLNRSIQRHQLEERERIATHAKALRESIDQAQRKSEEKQPATSSFLPDISSLRLGRRRPSTAKSTQSSRSETAASCKSATPRPSLAASTTTSFSTQMPDTKGDNFGTKAYRSLRTKVSGLFHPGTRQVSHTQDQTNLQYSPPPPMPKQDSASWARFTTSKASRPRRKDQSDSDQSFGHDPQVGEQRASSNRRHRRERAETVVPSGKRPPIPATLTEVVVSSRIGCEDQKSPSESPNDPRSLSSSFVLLDKVDPIGGPRGSHGPQK